MPAQTQIVLHPPIHRSRNGEYGFRLDIGVLEARAVVEWPIIHEDFQNSLPAYSLNCIVLGRFSISCPRPSRGLVHLVFSASPFTLDVGATQLGRLANYIFWSKFPKHPFWSLLPWRHLMVCSQTTALGRSRFDDSTDSKCASAREVSIEAQGCRQADEVHQFQLRLVWNEIILPKCLSHASQGAVPPPLQGGKSGHSLPHDQDSQSLSGAQLNKALTARSKQALGE